MKAELDIIDSMIFSKMKKIVTDEMASRGIMLRSDNFSTVTDNPSSSTFPFIFMTLVSGTETSKDLERDSLNGGLYTYQINVYDNESQERTRMVMNAVNKAFKSMLFTNIDFPSFASTDSIHRMIARWQRNIDEGDTI